MRAVGGRTRRLLRMGREKARVVSNGRHHHRRHTARKRRMCSEKTRFASELSAMRAGSRLGMDWYRCPYCGGFHLTSKNRMKGGER